MAGRFVGITLTGFVNGLASYGINEDFSTEIDIEKYPGWDDFAKRSSRFLGGIGVSYLDYTVNHQIMYGNYYGGHIEYYGYGNKMGIGSTKNTFIWLLFKGD